MSAGAFCAVNKPTVWQRLGFGMCGWPRMEDEDYPDLKPGGLVTETHVYLGWQDRLRILISGRMHVVTKIKTDVIVNKVVSTVATSIAPPKRKGA